MKKKIYYIVLVCILLTRTLHAQEIHVDGKVIDAEKHNAISDVSISVMQKDSMLIDFIQSAQDGSFSLQINTKIATYLYFSCIGYHSKILPLPEFQSGQDVFLKPQLFHIKEVEVTSRRLTQKGDTLVYLVSGFKLPQDRSIGDVLQNMPGLEVLPDGQVKYQGKSISKLYIEGADLLESKYGLAVRNLRAKDVEAVEVMEHHEAVKALKNTRFNEAAALNLKLKDSAKSRFIGVGDLGVGSGHSPLLWENRLLGMNMSNKLQNLSVYKNNNTGMDVTDELKSLTFDPFYSSDQSRMTGLLSSTEPGGPDLDQSRYLQNSSHLVSVNQLWKNGKDSQWRLQFSYVNNRMTSEGNTLTSYLLSKDSVRSVYEDTRMKAKEHKIEGELSYEMNQDAYYLKNQLSFSDEFDREQTLVDNRPGMRNLSLNSPHHIVSNRFSLIRNYDKKVLQIYSFNQFSSLPQRLSVRPELTDTLFTGLPYDVLSQQAKVNTFVSNTFTSFKFRIFDFYIGSEAGLRLQNDYVESGLERTAGEHIYQLPDSFRNNVHYLRTLVYAEPNVSYKGLDGRLSASLQLTLGYEFGKLKDRTMDSAEKSSFFVFRPQLKVHFGVTPLWEIGGSFIRNFQLDDVRGLYPGFVMTGYRDFQAFRSDLTSRYSNWYTVSTTFKNPMKGIFLSLTGGFSNDFEPFVEQVHFDGIVRIGDRLPIKHTNASKYLNIAGGQSFSFWNTRLSYNLSYDEMKYAYYMSDLSFYRMRSVTASPGLITQPFRFLNVEYKMAFSFMRMGVDDANVSGPVRATNQSLTFHIIPAERWLIDFTHSFYRNNRPEMPKCYFMDLSAAYRFRNESELRLVTTNLLNARIYRIETLGAFSTNSLTYPLRGREICLKYSFSF